MIKLKNESEIAVVLKKAGAAGVANGLDFVSAPKNGYLKAVYASYGIMGTDGTGAPTQDVVLDVKKNGTSIFSGATKVNWSHAKMLGTATTPIEADNFGALTANPAPVKRGDKIQLDCTQILNGTAPVQPQDLTVVLVFARGLQSPAPMLTGQISELD